MSGPSLAELREKGQPQAVLDRLNDEHWLGAPTAASCRRTHLIFARLGWSPNAVTIAFIVCGIAAGVAIALGGLATAIIGACGSSCTDLDCPDGEPPGGATGNGVVSTSTEWATAQGERLLCGPRLPGAAT
jgi:hypothetical protein